ncbi:MAG: hypothetical protein ACE5HY_06775, partial [Candidatus Hydrothermarchaeales archaeon]
MLPRDHPRYESLKLRDVLVEGQKEGVTVLQGLIAHGTAVAPTSTATATPTATAPAGEAVADKWTLWTNGTRLRGANI